MLKKQLTYLQHKLRQVTYRFKEFSDNPFFNILHRMYAVESSCFDFIKPYHMNGPAYIHSCFVAPESKTFCGKEIAIFSAKKLCIFWLPGAKHSGMGSGKEGKYTVEIRGAEIRKSLYISIDKNESVVNIKKISDMSNELVNEEKKLSGGYVIYDAIIPELSALILLWLHHISTFSKEIIDILNDAKNLPSEPIRKCVHNLLTTMIKL